MKELIGKTVGKIQSSSNEELIRFLDREENIIACYMVNAGCCSETWFSDIVNPSNLVCQYKGSPVVAVKDIPLPYSCDNYSRQEEDASYGVLITTEKGGDTVIAYRNSSNGYYGGSYRLCDDLPTNVIWKDVIDKDNDDYDWKAKELVDWKNKV